MFTEKNVSNIQDHEQFHIQFHFSTITQAEVEKPIETCHLKLLKVYSWSIKGDFLARILKVSLEFIINNLTNSINCFEKGNEK